jgi:hypothetical protein
MELSQEPQQPAKSLADELLLAICDPGHFPTEDNIRGPNRSLQEWQRDAVMQLLAERGHYLPGAPPAQKILEDAKSFAERLTLSNLALRLLNMLAWSNLETPESKPARRWLDDYLEGRNHGPAGRPMLWPMSLPGICKLMRDWGFEPTPTMPPFVARSLPNPGIN